MTWPTKGPDFNAWNADLDKFVQILSDNKDKPFWTVDWNVKYLNIRVDTRDNAFVLYGEDKEKISPDRVLKAIDDYKTKFEGEKT